MNVNERLQEIHTRKLVLAVHTQEEEARKAAARAALFRPMADVIDQLVWRKTAFATQPWYRQRSKRAHQHTLRELEPRKSDHQYKCRIGWHETLDIQAVLAGDQIPDLPGVAAVDYIRLMITHENGTATTYNPKYYPTVDEAIEALLVIVAERELLEEEPTL